MNKFYGNADVFSVRSAADLAMRDIYLDHHGMAHIQLGHRGLTNIAHTGLRSAVENPTSVFLSAENPSRYLFHAAGVLTKSGRPMMVVVQREDERGRVITASPHPNPNGKLIWESSGSIYSNYDEKSDLFYLSKGAACEAYVSGEEPHIWYRASDEDGSPVGVTVFDLKVFWVTNKDELKKKIANFLGGFEPEIDVRLKHAMQEFL